MKILLTLRPVIDWISQFMVKQVRVTIKQLPLWVLACSAPVEPGKASKMALKCSKCVSFRGRCPLDPRQGLCPWTPPGPLSGPLDPRPWGARAPLAALATLRIFSGPIMLGHLHPWQHDHRTRTCSSAWDPLPMLWDQLSTWGHRGQILIFTKNDVTKYFHVILTFASHLRDKQGNWGQSGVDVSKPAGYAVCDGNMSNLLFICVVAFPCIKSW